MLKKPPAAPVRPGIAQLKTGVSNQTARRPIAPPPFRPPVSPVQPKMANVVAARKLPVAPPVYKPQNGIQAKSIVGPHRPLAVVQKRAAVPKAPPVYRPQQVPKVLQRKKIGPNHPAHSRVAALPNPRQRAVSAAQLKARLPIHKQIVQAKPTHSAAVMKAAATAKVVRPGNAGGPPAVHSSSKQTIQRLIRFTHGARLKQNNVASSLANMVDYGITKTTLNGAMYPGGSKENFVSALLAPTLSVGKGSLGGSAVSVQSVPVQDVSYLMELPTGGPWNLRVSASNIKVKLGSQEIVDGVGIPVEDEEAGELTLNVRGLPTDAIFADLVEVHEDVHVGDIQTAINQILEPWDARLSQFRNHGTQFEGMSVETATRRLYEAAGGTPAEIADRFVNTLRHMGNVFHNTDAGKAPTIVAMTRSGPAEDSVLTVYLKHRAGLISLHEQRQAAAAEQRRRDEARLQHGISRSLARPVAGPINRGDDGNSFINNDML